MWFVYSLLGAILMTAYGLAIRLFLKDKGDSKTFTFITTLFGGIVILLLLPLEKITYLFNIQLIIIFLFLSLSYAITDLLFIRGRQLEEVSIVSILGQLSNFWALIGGTLIFKEALTLPKIIGVSLIVVGNISLVLRKQSISLSKGKCLILLATILFTINSFVDKKLSLYFSASLYKGILFILEAIMLFVFFLPQKIKAIKKEFKIQGRAIIIVGPLLSLAVFFLMKAFQSGGEASRVLPVFGLSLVFSVMAGILFLNEKGDLLKKIVAMILVLIGTYVLQLP